jgi:hypothetical protein
MATFSPLQIDVELDEIAQIEAEANARLAATVEAMRFSDSAKFGTEVIDSGNDAVLKKLLKVLSESEIEDLDAMSEADLRSRIVTVQRQRSDNAIAKEVDVDLKKAREEVKELTAPYTETEKRLAAITSYAVLRLQNMGK